MTERRSITSLQNSLVKHLVRLRSASDYRAEHCSLLLEGIKPIREVSGIRKLFYTSAYASMVSTLPGEKWEISAEVLRKISGLMTPEGIVAEIQMPPFVKSFENAKQVLAFDGVSDPGNLGTLLRTAVAFGWDTVYFLPNSCDPFNEKTLRAARGAHFNIHLMKGTAEQLQTWVESENIQALVADLEGIPPETISKAYRRLFVVGNEAHGPSTSIFRYCQRVTLPMQEHMESLNVAIAGGILLYVLSTIK